jgi:hypothetical protein
MPDVVPGKRHDLFDRLDEAIAYAYFALAGSHRPISALNRAAEGLRCAITLIEASEDSASKDSDHDAAELLALTGHGRLVLGQIVAASETSASIGGFVGQAVAAAQSA